MLSLIETREVCTTMKPVCEVLTCGALEPVVNPLE